MQKTLNDWIKKFYPIKACYVIGGNRELLKHSLKKWKGATKENTEAYNCVYADYSIVAKRNISDTANQDRLALGFGYNTCALCLAHKHKEQFGGVWYDCNKCIIVLSGNPSCLTGGSAYAESKNDPAPMIALLEKLLQEINEN